MTGVAVADEDADDAAASSSRDALSCSDEITAWEPIRWTRRPPGPGALASKSSGASSDEHDEHENETTPAFDLAVGTAGGEPGMSSSAACSAAGATPPAGGSAFDGFRLGGRRERKLLVHRRDDGGASAPDGAPASVGFDPLVRRLVEERRCFGVPDGVVSGVSSPEEFECIASDCIVVIFGSDEVEVPTPIDPDIDAARLAEEDRFSMRRFDLT